MIFTDIDILNFLGIGQAKISLDDKGLVLIQGENKDDSSADSNGSGKSSLTDALAWCIYGKTARGLAGDDVINLITKKNCVVKSTLIDGENVGLITRWRKCSKRDGYHKSSGVKFEINGVDKTGGTDAITQKHIDEFVGATEQVFNASIYAAQETMPDIPSMSDRALKSLIEEAAGVDLIESAYNLALSDARDAKEAVAAARMKLDDANDKRDRAEERYKEIGQDILDWKESHKHKIDAAQNVLNEARAALVVAKEKLKKADIAAIDEKIKKNREVHNKLQVGINKISDMIMTGMAPELEQKNALYKAFEDADTEKLHALERYEDSERNLARCIKDLESVKSVKVCSECGTEVGDDQAEEIKAKRKGEVQQAQDELKDQEKKMKLAAAKAEKAHQAYQNYLPTMTDFAELRNKRERATKLAVETSSEYDELRDQRAEAEKVSDRIETRKERVSELKNALQEVKELENPHEKSLARAKEQLNEATAAIEPAYINLEVQSDALKVATACAGVFGPKGVRAHILDTVTPYLNDRTAHYLSTLSDGNLEAVWSTLTENKAGETVENFQINVSKYGEGSFRGLSGGEKRKVRLATTLGLQDLVASRATKPIQLWVGDEIDTALDAAGLERLMTLLEMKAREKGTVLIISHLDLGDWVRDVAKVTMEDKQATVEGVICR